jgi:hypothetical protein
MTIHFNADLRPVLGKQVGMLHWIMDPEVSGFIIGYDLSGNQVLICNFDVRVHYQFTPSGLTVHRPSSTQSRVGTRHTAEKSLQLLSANQFHSMSLAGDPGF